jgi:hypothetical protein
LYRCRAARHLSPRFGHGRQARGCVHSDSAGQAPTRLPRATNAARYLWHTHRAVLPTRSDLVRERTESFADAATGVCTRVSDMAPAVGVLTGACGLLLSSGQLRIVNSHQREEISRLNDEATELKHKVAELSSHRQSDDSARGSACGVYV